MSVRRPYPTDLSEEEWRVLEPLVPDAKPGGRPRTYEARELLDAVFYVLRGGCARRLLPRESRRGMSRDYEFLPETTEALIYVAMSRLMPKRLVKGAS